MEALSNFKTAVNRHVEGIHPHNDLRNSLRRITVAFEEELHGQRPGFFASTPAGYEKRVISLLTDDEGSDDECSVTSTTLKTPSKSHKRPHHEESPTKRPRIEEPSANDIKTPLGMQSLLGTPHTGQTQRGPTKLRLRLNQIRETLADLSLSNIPSETDPRAVDHLRSQSIMGWEPPMDRFLKRVGERLQVSLDHLLAEACDGWLTTEFYKESRQMLRTFLSTIMSQQREHAHRALRLEMAQPLTMNEEGFESHRTKELSRLEDERLTRRVFEDLKKKERDTAADRDATRERHEALFKRAKDEKKLRDAMDAKPDPFQREVEAMASVLGYYNVALVRFLDHIVQGIHGEALHQCREELSRQLRAGLMVDSPEGQFSLLSNMNSIRYCDGTDTNFSSRQLHEIVGRTPRERGPQTAAEEGEEQPSRSPSVAYGTRLLKSGSSVFTELVTPLDVMNTDGIQARREGNAREKRVLRSLHQEDCTGRLN